MTEDETKMYKEWEKFNAEMALVAPEEIDVMGQFILDQYRKAKEVFRRETTKKLLDSILFIGEDIPQSLADNMDSKYVLKGVPNDLL